MPIVYKGMLLKVMKSKKSNLMCIILAIIVLCVGMCSGHHRTDSYSVSFQQHNHEESFNKANNETVSIGNCTYKLITGLRDSIPRSRRVIGRIGLRNYVEFHWIKEILQLFVSISFVASLSILQIQSSDEIILNYIHNQDGEK